MGHEESAMKSWLPQVGTTERKIILMKLKKQLQEKGMSGDEVYKGMLQLTTPPRVFVARLCSHDYRYQQSPSNSDIVEHEKWPSPKAFEPDKYNEPVKLPVKLIPELKRHRSSSNNDIVENSVDSDRPRKSTTPELMDENIGIGAPFNINEKPRKIIKLNLNSRCSEKFVNSQKIANEQQKIATSTVIRLADSSVSDNDDNDCSSLLRKITNNDESSIIDEEIATKKPKIIDDVTCLEGTILARAALMQSSINSVKSSTTHDNIPNEQNNRLNDRDDEKSLRTLSRNNNCIINKQRTRIPWLQKKLRLRRKFRQCFGNNQTTSEIEEEDDIIERFLPKTRTKTKHHSSNFTNSKIVTIEENSQLIFNLLEKSSPRDVPKFVENSLREKIQKRKNNNNIVRLDNLLVRSMPLLDSTSTEIFLVNSSDDNTRFMENIPDSSTCNEENTPNQPHSSYDDEKIRNIVNSNKLTIVVSPLNQESPDAFIPVSFEIDVPCDAQLSSTPTSTTGYFPVVNSASTKTTTKTNNESKEISLTRDNDLTKLLDMQLLSKDCDITLNGNTISIRENSGNFEKRVENSELPKTLNNNETISMNYRETEISDKPTDLTVNVDDSSNQEETIITEPCPEKMAEILPETNVTACKSEELPEIEEKLEISLSEVSSIEEISNKAETTDKNDDFIEESQAAPCLSAATAPPPPPTIPKFRVLHHTELGSRWCPTPLNNDNNNDATLRQREESSNLPDNSLIPPIVTFQQNTPENVPSNQQQQYPPASLESLEMLFSNVPASNTNPNNASTRTINNTSTNTTNYPQRVIRPAPTRLVYGPQISPNIVANSMLGSILSLFLDLDLCIERNKTFRPPHEAQNLREQFERKKPLLWCELRKFGIELGTHDLAVVTDYIVNYYDDLMPPGQRFLNMDKVLNVLSLEHLPPHQMPVEQYWMQNYYSTVSSMSSNNISRPSASTYPSFHSMGNQSSCYVNQLDKRLASDRSSTSSSSSSWQSTSVRRPLASVPITGIFSPEQLSQLREQINIYNQLLKFRTQQTAGCLLPRRMRQTKKRTRNSASTEEIATTAMRATATTASVENSINCSRVDDVLLPIFLEESQWNDTRRDISDPAPLITRTVKVNTVNVDKPEINTRKPEENTQNAEITVKNTQNADKPEKNTKKADKPEKNKENADKPENIARKADKTEKNKQKADKTEENTRKADKNTQKSITHEVSHVRREKETQVTKKTSRNVVRVADVLQELAVLSSSKDSNNKSSNIKNKKRSEQTKNPEVSSSPLTPGGSSIIIESSVVNTAKEPEILHPLLKNTEINDDDRTDANEIEKNINEQSPNLNEVSTIVEEDEAIIDKTNDEVMILAESTISKSHVSVITIEDNDDIVDSDTETLPCNDEIQTNFSILDVKSISKDVFNSIGERDNVVASETAPLSASCVSRDANESVEARESRDPNDNESRDASESRDANDNESGDANVNETCDKKDNETNVTKENGATNPFKLETGQCLRCGEPSSVVCEQCYEAFYCSSDCHEIHWMEHHHSTCKPVPAEALAQIESNDSSKRNDPSLRG